MVVNFDKDKYNVLKNAVLVQKVKADNLVLLQGHGSGVAKTMLEVLYPLLDVINMIDFFSENVKEPE